MKMFGDMGTEEDADDPMSAAADDLIDVGGSYAQADTTSFRRKRRGETPVDALSASSAAAAAGPKAFRPPAPPRPSKDLSPLRPRGSGEDPAARGPGRISNWISTKNAAGAGGGVDDDAAATATAAADDDDDDYCGEFGPWADDDCLSVSSGSSDGRRHLNGVLRRHCEGAFRRLEVLKSSWVRVTIRGVRIDGVRMAAPPLCYLGGFNISLKVRRACATAADFYFRVIIS